ncbi:MAG TPA: hypothetical protein VGM90_31860 [Kofleriaceae bacterium]
MISSARGLVLLAAVAVAMVATLFIDLHRAEPARDHMLVSGFDESRVVKLSWANPSGPPLAIERGTPHAPWRRTLPSAGDVDQNAVGDILAALRGGRWQRVGNVAEAGAGQTKLTIEMRTDTGVESIELGVGEGTRVSQAYHLKTKEPVADAQEWIARGDRAYLVDAWVAHALQPDALALAVTHPFAPAANAPSIRFWNHDGDVTVSGDGTDNRILQLGTGPTITDHGVRLDPAIAHELERALATIEVVELSSAQPTASTQTATPIANTNTLQIEWAGTRADLGATGCNGNETLVEVMAPSGGGCVEASAAGDLRDLVAKLRGPATAIAARAPIPFAVGVVELADGQTLDVTKSPKIGVRTQLLGMGAADRDRTQQLLAALATRATVIDFAPASAPPGALTEGPGARTLFIRGDHGAEQTLVLGDRPIVWRAGERVALRVTPEAYDAIARQAKDYVDLLLWSEEPTTITNIEVAGRAFSRGAVIGEWTGAKNPASVDALLALLSAPRALELVARNPVGPDPKDTVRITIHPPTGPIIEHILRLASGPRCEAETDTGIYLLKPEVCAAARAAK